MKMNGNTILITGGATGIGLALAEAFVQAGNKVIICARTEENLKQAKEKLPQLHIRKCDVSKEEDCEALYAWVTANFKDMNVLINNAGIQRMIDFRKGTEDLIRHRMEDGEDEIDANLKSLVYMTALFTPHLMKQKEAAIMNVSSGLVFYPMPAVPIYCATKAAVHTLSILLRQQLEGTSVKVFELIPPMVDTNLDKGARKARGQTYFGITTAELVQPTMKAFESDEYEIRVIDPKLASR
ncbi:SDR family NAD(P)-dependent oxidoreductase [Methanolobus sediminis]|uniref:SDR family NAD(P)-dependent oxidoreductase n=1 Tax=Methanolobus sediminis TaxID=3072978 RepID=A0AA51UK35_9EURY|nr:SDR family NAD(P)-dependent oxidoreductase [Methanolobus sediminis]WMW25043.1 SDR family NAD(P)-dependent oxidoreductase [Methanolobus sediminis]